MGKSLRVNHGPVPADVLETLTDEERAWLISWNREGEIPDDLESDDQDADSDVNSEDQDDVLESTGIDPEDQDEDGDEPTGDYSELSRQELKSILEDRGLPVDGNKGVLIQRLEDDDVVS